MPPRLHLTRRSLIARASALAVASLVAPWNGSRIARARGFDAYPFLLGVASGDPVSDGFVVWTRIAPYPFDAERMGRDPVEVRWAIAEDETMRGVVARGSELARPDRGFAVHAEARGLKPGRPYWYQFAAGGEASPIGRAITAPILGSRLDRLRFAFASCQHYEQGHFTAYREMLKDGCDLVVHLGDYIYESSWGDPARRHEGPEPLTLAQYRTRHALYKMEPHLQAMHAAAPFLVTWDDHEVDNDYAADQPEDGMDPAEFVKRRAAAFQAYWEHMPLRLSQALHDGRMRLYGQNVWGDLLAFHILDTRQFRSDQACPSPDVPGQPVKRGGQQVGLDACADLADPLRTMLGPEQERWLLGTLPRSKARWNVLAQSLVFAGLVQKTADGEAGAWSDGWDGYPPARGRILDRIVESKLSNPVVIAGDIHSFWANDIKRDYRSEASPVVATEFVSGSISAAGPDYDQFMAFKPENPHVKFFDSRQRGYALCTVTPDNWRTDFRTVQNVRDPDTAGGTLSSWVVENGKPGASEL